jgi:hypothetical protein
VSWLRLYFESSSGSCVVIRQDPSCYMSEQPVCTLFDQDPMMKLTPGKTCQTKLMTTSSQQEAHGPFSFVHNRPNFDGYLSHHTLTTGFASALILPLSLLPPTME